MNQVARGPPDSLLSFRQTDIRLNDDILGDKQEAVRQSPGIGWTKAKDGFAEAHFNHIKALGPPGNLHLLASDICNCGHLLLLLLSPGQRAFHLARKSYSECGLPGNWKGRAW